MKYLKCSAESMPPDDTLKWPQWALVKQSLYSSPLTSVASSVFEALESTPLFHNAKKGDRIAVAVGSRGIANLDTIVSACLQFLKKSGLHPFIVPAMGSHGGATPRGQQQVLAGLGLPPAGMGVPIEADLAADCVDRLDCGMKVYVSRQALSADHIFVINRVKPHTKFTAERESGLAKMLAVGLGKASGAAEIHRWAVTHSFCVIDQAAEKIMACAPVCGGLAILEDGYGQTSRLAAVGAGELMEAEKALLKEAYAMLPQIPLDGVDVLVVDQIGKNISGIGMDSNVTGRHRDITGNLFQSPHVKRIFVRDLSPESRGNANGIGLADFTTGRVVRAMGRERTYVNARTAISPEKAAIPMWFDSDREAMGAAVATCGLENPEKARIVRIKNTAHMEHLWISRAFEEDLRDHPSLLLSGGWEAMRFDDAGNLADGFPK